MMSIRLKVFFAAFLMSGILASVSLKAEESVPEKLGLFSAIEQGKVEVKVVAKNSLQSKLIVTNKTKTPLRVDLPSSFALVPVLAQDFMGGSGGVSGTSSRSSTSRSSTSSSGSQSTGSGYGSSSGNRSSSGSNNWSLLPEKTIQETVRTVCLEHGKKEPSPRTHYAIRPITDVTDNRAVHLLCEKVGVGEVDQNSAQAAVWHLNSEVSWEELAAKFKKTAYGGKIVSYFNRDQMNEAIRLAEKAVGTIEEEERAMAGTEAGPSLAN
ncbi:MAG: hypothetical protein LBQ54_03575 [Planctomycetaceae bacterium]|jgi:hypothetical protein|nr:hypothetical protein [Planctomycetaceae bacterium]